VAASIDVLCDHPDQWELLRNTPDLALPAVDETIRHSGISNSLLRTATADVELAGVLFPAGTMVFANTAAANRDPAIYDNPDHFDITRKGLPPVLTFGAGVHYCLGANLARLEIAEALKTVTRRISNPRRTGPAPWEAVFRAQRSNEPPHRLRHVGRRRFGARGQWSLRFAAPAYVAVAVIRPSWRPSPPPG
jgi:cytochrome P450